MSPILDDVITQVVKITEYSKIFKETELKKTVEKPISKEDPNIPNPFISMLSFSRNLLTRKPKICLSPLPQTKEINKIPLIPSVNEEDSDSSTTRTSQDEEQSGSEDIKKLSNFSSDDNNSVKRGRKRKSEISIPQLPVEVSTGNDSSNSASSTVDLGRSKRKRFKNVRLLDIDDVVKKSPNRKK